MSIIRRRRIKSSDIENIARQLAPLQRWYGPDFNRNAIRATVTKLAGENAVTSLLVERVEPESNGANERLLGFGFAGFIDLALARELIDSPPQDDVPGYLYGLEQRGIRCFLRPEEQGACNAGEGMALLFLHFYTPALTADGGEAQQVISLMYDSFRIGHAGNNTRILMQPRPDEDTGLLESLLAQGYWTAEANPNIVMFDLDKLKGAPFHPLATIRSSVAPRLGFSYAEKDLLCHALHSRSDEELAQDLNISLDTVRKRWRNIYQRISDHPEINLFSDQPLDTDNKTRGRGKRQLVLQYIQDHLEEIRPYNITK